MQHVYERTSNKNRRQGNPPSHQSHDDDMDHVISNEETITNEATDPVIVVDNNDDVNELDVISSLYDDDIAVNNSEVTNSNNADVAVSNNTVVTVSNNSEVIVSNNTDVTTSSSDVLSSNDTVAIGNNDVPTDGTWDKREEKYCAEISNLTRSIELHRIREEELLNNLTELQNKYKSLEERSSQKIDTICSEREWYKMERDELQRKIDSAADVTPLASSQQRANVSPPLTPHSNTCQQVNHRDIKVMYSSTH